MSYEDIFSDLDLKHVSFDEICELWEEVGKILKVDPHKLRLDDRFDYELQELDPWPIDGRITDLEYFVGKKQPNSSKKQVNNLREMTILYFED